MVKIIIELSEEYIAQMSDLDNVKKVEMGGGSRDLLYALTSALSFKAIEKEVENGKKEFVLNRETLPDENAKKLFDNRVDDICALATVLGQKDEE